MFPFELIVQIHKCLQYEDRKSLEKALGVCQPIIHRLECIPDLKLPSISTKKDYLRSVSSVKLKIGSGTTKEYHLSFNQYVQSGPPIWTVMAFHENDIFGSWSMMFAQTFPPEYNQWYATDSNYPIDFASVSGNVEQLQSSVFSVHPIWTPHSMDGASYNGHIHILKWWRTSGFECRWTHLSMDYASRQGHIDVLKWWKTSGLQCKYTFMSIVFASQRGHINILEWWWNSGLECKWSDDLFMQSGIDNNVREWWNAKGLQTIPAL